MSRDLSIIIRVYNSENIIEECLKNIINEAKSFNYEIIVVDDCSKDKTADVVNKFDNIKLIKLKKNMGVGNARNIGMDEAKYDFLCYIDSDLIISKDSINNLFSKINQNEEIGSVGAIPVLPNLNKKSWSSNFVALKALFGFREAKEEWDVSEIQSEFCIIKKNFLKKIGGWLPFKKAGGEEFELGYRIINNKKRNLKISDASYTTSWDNLYERLIKIIQRTDKYLNLFIKKKSFESDESFASMSQGLSSIFSSFIFFLLIINIFISNELLFYSLFVIFFIQIIVEKNFILYSFKIFGLKMLIFSLFAIHIINLGILLGGLLFLFKIPSRVINLRNNKLRSN